MDETGQPGAAAPGENGNGAGSQGDPPRPASGWEPAGAGWSPPAEPGGEPARPRWAQPATPIPTPGWATPSGRYADLPAPFSPTGLGNQPRPAHNGRQPTNGTSLDERHGGESAPTAVRAPTSAPPYPPEAEQDESAHDRLAVPMQRPTPSADPSTERAPAAHQPPEVPDPADAARHAYDDVPQEAPPPTELSRWRERLRSAPASAPPADPAPPAAPAPPGRDSRLGALAPPGNEPPPGFEMPPGFQPPSAYERPPVESAAAGSDHSEPAPAARGGERDPATLPRNGPDHGGPEHGEQPDRGTRPELPAASERVGQPERSASGPAGADRAEDGWAQSWPGSPGQAESGGRRGREDWAPRWGEQPQPPPELARPAYVPAAEGPAYPPAPGAPAYPTRPDGPGYPPAAEGPVYPPVSGGAAYAPASGAPAYAVRPEAPAYAPASGAPVYAPASGAPVYAAQPEAPAYAPASGAAAYAVQPEVPAQPVAADGPPATGAQGYPARSGGPGYPPTAEGPVYPPASGGPAYPAQPEGSAYRPPAAGPAYPPASGGPGYPPGPPASGGPGYPPGVPASGGPGYPPGAGGTAYPPGSGGPGYPGGPAYPPGDGPAYPPASGGPAYPASRETGYPPMPSYPGFQSPAPEPVAPVPAGRPAEPNAEALPQRVPAEPDVPTVPEPPAELPAEAPELARIATHLRREEAPSPVQDRPEGFDVRAILAAVRGVAGVRDASLRRTPAGAHSLRLDLSDGADPAEVSRLVARLLQERMGLAAAPQNLPGSVPPPRPVAPERRLTPPVPAGPAWRPAEAQSPEEAAPEEAAPEVPRRRRAAASHRGRAPVEERDDDVEAPAAASNAVTANTSYSGSQLTTTETAPSRPLNPGVPPGPRVVLDHVQVSTFGLEATVEVRLVAGTQQAAGLSTGPAVDGYVLRLCAVSAAAAIDELLRHSARVTDLGRCFVEHAAVVPFGSCEVATVVVLLVCDGWVEQLAGSALVAGDQRQAVVRATLAAVNRRLEALLA